jgi:hypothetical protein
MTIITTIIIIIFSSVPGTIRNPWIGRIVFNSYSTKLLVSLSIVR